MTITYLGEIPGERSGRNTMGTRTYTRAFRLESSLVTEGPYQVGSHLSLPLIGSVHPEDPEAYCVEVEIRNTDPWKGWTYSAQYSADKELTTHPLHEPATIEWDGENFEEIVWRDRNRSAILNSAGDPFENLMRERTRRVATITKNIGNVPSWLIDSEDAINSAAFFLDGVPIPAGMAKVGAPRIGWWQKRNGFSYRVLTYQVKINKDGWGLRPLDAGFCYISDGQKIRVMLEDGTDPTQPVCLNGVGGILANPTPDTAVFGYFDVYPLFNFTLLPLT